MESTQSGLLSVVSGGRLIQVAPRLSSAGLSWEGVGADEYLLRDIELPDRELSDHLVTLQLSRPVKVSLHPEGRPQRRWMLPGHSCVLPQGAKNRANWRGNRQLMFIRLSTLLVEQTADEMGIGGRYDVAATLGAADANIEYLGRALQAELSAGNPTGRLFAESLGRALAARILTSPKLATPPTLSPLPPSVLRRVLSYIEDHITEDVSLNALAGSISMSPYHFARSFKAAVGTPPHRYVLARRLELAKELLAKTELPIAEVAARVGCADQSHLTSLFRRMISTTPAAYRRTLVD